MKHGHSWRRRLILHNFLFLSFIFSWLCISLLTSSAYGNQVPAIDRIIEKQKAIQTLSAEFTQEKHSTMLRDPLISKGEFHFKAPDRVAWFYTGQIQIVSDGKKLTLYYPALKEAEIVPLDNTLIRLPLNFNLTELRQFFRHTIEEKEGRFVVTLTPLDESSMFSRMIITLLEIGAPETVEMFERSGDRSTITFFNQKVNKGISEQLFDLHLPEDTVIRRFRQP